MSGPILAAASLQRKVTLFQGAASQALAVEAKMVGKDVMDP